MRKSKIVNIEGLGEVVVKEVSPYAIYQAMNSTDKISELQALADDCVGLPREKLYGLYPSEIEQIVDAFVEVNSSFLAIAAKLRLKAALTDMASTVGKTLPQLFIDSYRQIMDQQSGITAGAAS